MGRGSDPLSYQGKLGSSFIQLCANHAVQRGSDPARTLPSDSEWLRFVGYFKTLGGMYC